EQALESVARQSSARPRVIANSADTVDVTALPTSDRRPERTVTLRTGAVCGVHALVGVGMAVVANDSKIVAAIAEARRTVASLSAISVHSAIAGQAHIVVAAIPTITRTDS